MKKNGLGNRLFLALVFLFLYAPIFVLIVFSFNATKSRSVWAGFSLQWYGKLFSDASIIDALRTTLLVSAAASVIACIAGTAAAIGIAALRRKHRSVVMTTSRRLSLFHASTFRTAFRLLIVTKKPHFSDLF